MAKPSYFDEIQSKAAKRWEQLDSDKGLAAPWHQLFRQVQSPRHVISELLQNADDAGAKNVDVEFDESKFIFLHDGKDFSKDDFASLCEFGFSNKRNLHTIGFRGVGFKSTFSIGSRVFLITPSLSVKFKKEHFTKPEWVPDFKPESNRKKTLIVVKMDNAKSLGKEMEKNISEWAENPISLLFFKNIKEINLNGKTIVQIDEGKGPVDRSHWVKLSEDQEDPYLLIRSKPLQLPSESVEEIRKERMLSEDEDYDLPPVEIDLLLGSNEDGRLYVVLPTQVETELPFAINAPFIQDPARMKIKSPSISPTNEWILEKAGELAASCMVDWLENDSLDAPERCRAYSLLPDVDRESGSLAKDCETICETGFEYALLSQSSFILADNGVLMDTDTCISIPKQIYDVWQPRIVSKLFSDEESPLVCRYVESEHIKSLANWDFIKSFDEWDLLEALKAKTADKPKTWKALISLWKTVYEAAKSGYYSFVDLSIIPVNGSNFLHKAKEVCRLGEDRVLRDEADWSFIEQYLLVMDRNWQKHIAAFQKKADKEESGESMKTASALRYILATTGLDSASDIIEVFAKVSNEFFSSEKSVSIKDCVRLTHIAAELNVKVPESFGFYTISGKLKNTGVDGSYVCIDNSGLLDLFIGDEEYDDVVLHERYFKDLKSYLEKNWREWISSERSRLMSFIPIIPKKQEISRAKAMEIARDRGFSEELKFPYNNDRIHLHDWDFENSLWRRWREAEKTEKDIWVHLLRLILEPQYSIYVLVNKAHMEQSKSTHSKKKDNEVRLDPTLDPKWLIEMRELPCLRDSRGINRKPSDLLLRTKDTLPLLDIENFIEEELDIKANREMLLCLGVGDRPTGPEKVLKRLSALSRSKEHHVDEAGKWYESLDKLVEKCSTEEIRVVKDFFKENAIILTEDMQWVTSEEVSIGSDEDDVPNAPTIHKKFRELSLWRRINISPKPSAERAIKWFKTMKSVLKVPETDRKRVKNVLRSYPQQIWDECSCWLNLLDEIIEIERLEYRVTEESNVQTDSLFDDFKNKTADMRMLPQEKTGEYPFDSICDIADCIEEEIPLRDSDIKKVEDKLWMREIGEHISRIRDEGYPDKSAIMENGARLAKTKWVEVKRLRVQPLIAGLPAGEEVDVKAKWKQERLYVCEGKIAAVCKHVARELSMPFADKRISDAISTCIDRDGKWIEDYFEENFELISREEAKENMKTVNIENENRERESKENAAEEIEESIKDLEDERDFASEKIETEEETYTEVIQRKRSKKPRERFIDFFAKSKGFVQASGNSERYQNHDGRFLEKSTDESSIWQEFSENHSLNQKYYLEEICLEDKPLILKAEIYKAIDRMPDDYTLVLTNRDGNPKEISGNTLKKLISSQKLRISVDCYRISNH